MRIVQIIVGLVFGLLAFYAVVNMHNDPDINALWTPTNAASQPKAP